MCGCAARRRCGRLVREKRNRDVLRRGIRKAAALVNLEMKRTAIHFAPLLCAAVLLAPSMTSGTREPAATALELTKPGEPTPARVSADRTGSLQTSDGLTLRLSTDLGSVKIVPLEGGSAPVVRYTVHIETDARAPLAQHLLDHYSLSAKSTPAGVEITGKLPPQSAHLSGAQIWVQFEIVMPRNYSVEVKTEAGDIETGDIGGIASLTTQGGNIHAGRIGVSNARNAGSERLVARLETEGGHIQVQDVAGDLRAFTAGGHINAGNIAGDASLRSGGGHIRAGQIGGRADLQTDGGNITVGQAGSLVSVRTGGGQIDFGEVRGSVRAQTGGGGIRIMYVSGPMEVESSAGSICLTRVAGTVRAATAGGTITAWINPDAPSAGGKCTVPPEEGASGLIHAVIVPPAVAARTVPATRVKQMLPALDSTSIGPDTYMMRMPPPPVCARTEPRTSPKSICPPPVRTLTRLPAWPTVMLPPSVCKSARPPICPARMCPPPLRNDASPAMFPALMCPPAVNARKSPAMSCTWMWPPSVSSRATPRSAVAFRILPMPMRPARMLPPCVVSIAIPPMSPVSMSPASVFTSTL